MKKTWQAPQLIVLVRSEPEEMVLANCKSESVTLSPTYWYSYCDVVSSCTGCSAVGSS